jgi:2-dehydro-3-deoxyphosphooctonate aldolase (KDO 8-P synthase)
VTHSFKVGKVQIGGGELFLIAGPCVIESEDHALKMAECITGVAKALGMPYIFKASYDKANRTSLKSFRGPGMKEGLRILAEVARQVQVPVLTDVHDVRQAEIAAEVVDVLQIPAFLCRQTDLLVAAARTGRAVNIKKGQFVAPQDMRHAVYKVRDSGNDRVFLTERGASFGYQNLVVDMRALPIMRRFAPVVFDATHSVQLPSASDGVGTGGTGSSQPVREGSSRRADDRRTKERREKAPAVSGGQPEFIPVLARAAVAAGVDGVFMEVHDDPAHAKSDGPNALDLKHLRSVLKQLLVIHAVATKTKT